MMWKIYYKKQEHEHARQVAGQAVMSGNFYQRLLGLMFRKSFGRIDAMILNPCSAVHTFFMRFSIDVICLDKDSMIIDLAHALPPGRVFRPHARASTIIELPPGTIEQSNIGQGDNVIIVDRSEKSIFKKGSG